MFNNLMLGSSGDSVKMLQEKLKILGFFNGVVTGSFGLETKVGVEAFQKSNDLEVTGIVTSEVWNLLFEDTSSRSTVLSLGDTGSDVSTLQEKLLALLYYTEDITGVFDTETEIAVKRLQYHNNLTTTGIVDSATNSVIDNLYGNLNSCVTGEIESSDANTNYISYTVVSGDTLYNLANTYGTTVDEIKELNNLSSNILSIGQTLLIPSDNEEEIDTTNYLEYVIKSGDTLYNIAKNYNTTVSEIMEINNLSSTILSIGDVLLLPVYDNYLTYTIKSGDTLYSLAKFFDTTVDTLKTLNNLSSNTLTIGNTLLIPSSNNYLFYMIESGDTLYSLAKTYNTTVNDLKELNNLSNDILTIGSILKIALI